MSCDGKQITLEIRTFEESDTEAVVQLWTECALVVPWNDPVRDIQRKLAVQPNLFLVGCIAAKIIATVMAGYDGHRGWINYLAVASSRRRQGVGRGMMEEAERRLRVLGCPKINLQVRNSNTHAIDFYNRLGFSEDDVVSFGKRLISDED